MVWPAHFECEQCSDRITVPETQARTVAGDGPEPERAARLTAERLHGYVDPQGIDGLVCPDCLTTAGAEQKLF